MTDPLCPVDIPFADVQGNILTGYGRLGFPFARFGLVRVVDAQAGRDFVEALRTRVTTAVRWKSERKENAIPQGRLPIERPKVTLNLAFTFYGLLALGVPTRTMRGMPEEFIDGMATRRDILGDDTAENKRADWDPIWLPAERRSGPHILIMLNAQENGERTPVPALADMCKYIADLCAPGKVELLKGHRGPDEYWQHLETLRDPQTGMPCPKEHFGYTDGISDPVFLGQYAQGEEEARSVGFGATDGAGKWRPLAAGEFLLGWPDEAQEIPGGAMPLDFSRNGTFFAYRKLHQDIDGFNTWVDWAAGELQKIWKLENFKVAKETLLAKMAGRWSDGVPLTVAPTYDEWEKFNQRCPPKSQTVRDDSERQRALVDFLYREDPDGTRCPMTSHIRRSNTRDMLDPRAGTDPKARMGSALNNRRRIIRRGLPYGKAGAADGEHGVVMMVVCASLARQFEFVQQQWINYGLDSNAGNDACPVIGNHGPNARFTIPADPAADVPPFIASKLTQWVQTRGGDYFFMPSMTALRMIGMGVVDPT